MQSYRLRLALTWIVGGGVILLIVVIQSLLGHFGDDPQHAWEWLLPNLTPILALVLGVTGLTKAGDVPPEGVKTLFAIVMAASIFYLLMLALPILLQPLVSDDPLALLKMSGLWLGPLQGLTTTLLGIFFTRETPPPKKEA